MTELYVDPDGLTAVSEVARRQHDHVGRVADYIGAECSRFGAFSGVLNIFEGSYRSAVQSAKDGMRDGQTIATKMQDSVLDCRRLYLDTDQDAYDALKTLMGTQEGFPPYEAPGSGNSTPAGPLSGPPPPDGPDVDGDPFKVPELPAGLSEPFKGPLDRVVPGPEGNEPPSWLDPQKAAKEALLDQARQRQLEDRYLDYREQGMSPADARDAAHAGESVDDRASTYAHDRMQDRAESAYDAAHRDALADGRSESEAMEAGRDAAQDQHHGDALDHQNRQDVLGAAGTYQSAYDEAGDLVDNAQSIADNVDQIRETTSDLDDYDDYENRPDDHSAQDWGNR